MDSIYVLAVSLYLVQADIEDCPGFGKPCPPNQKCCLEGNACCTFIHLRPDIRKLTSEKFAIWNLWFFWFLTIFVLMICTGVCAYWRSRYRTRYVSARSLVWSALDPYSLSTNFPNFSTATTLEPRIIQHFQPINWQRHRDFLTNLRTSRISRRNPMVSSLGLVRGNGRLTLQPTLMPGIVEGAQNSVLHSSAMISNGREISLSTFVPHPPSYAEAITVRSEQNKCLPPPYDKQTSLLKNPGQAVSNSSVHANENFLISDSPPPYNSLSVDSQ